MLFPVVLTQMLIKDAARTLQQWGLACIFSLLPMDVDQFRQISRYVKMARILQNTFL